MIENQATKTQHCKHFVNLLKNMSFLQEKKDIYMNPLKKGKKRDKGEIKWEWQSTMKMT